MKLQHNINNSFLQNLICSGLNNKFLKLEQNKHNCFSWIIKKTFKIFIL